MSLNNSVKQDTFSNWLMQFDDWNYFNYSNIEHFEELWSPDTDPSEWDQSNRFLIDWKGFPLENRIFAKITEFITPLDWALAIAHVQTEADPRTTGLPQVVIVDRCSHRYSDSFAVEMRQAITDALPHVQIFSALGNDQEDALALIKFLKSNSSSLGHKPNIRKMRALHQAWIGYTVQSGDHHDLSNLLGPLILSTGFTDDALCQDLFKDPLTQALLQKIIWLKLDGAAGGKTEKWFDFAPVTAKIGCTRIVLIDDQANQGWLDIVNAALGLPRSNTNQVTGDRIECFAKSQNLEVYASSSFHAIKNYLNKIGISSEGILTDRIDQRFKYSLTGQTNEILLLDLRLFFNERDEIEYFNWILSIADNLKRSNFSSLVDLNSEHLRAWMNNAVIDKSTNWRKDSEYLTLLTLLPRILASLDMALPIIVFSSTGQRQVTEAFKNYHNIITIFKKPNFFGYSNDSLIEETKRGFSAAIQAAIPLLKARAELLQLLAIFPPPQATKQPITQSQPQGRYVEIFIDESGTPEEGNNFVVAGIALVHESVDQARKLHKAMENKTVHLTLDDGAPLSANLNWCGPDKMPKRLTDAKNLRTVFEPAKFALHELFTKYTVGPTGFVSFAISAKLDQLKTSGKLKGLATHNLDSAYLELFEWLTDIVLYEFLPEIIDDHSNIKIKIYGATRDRPNDKGTLFSLTEKETLTDNWGMFGFYDGTNSVTGEPLGLYKSLNETSFTPLVVNVMSGRPHPRAKYMADGTPISGAVGYCLTYGWNPPNKFGKGHDFFRHAHYIADLVANATYISLDEKYRVRDVFSGFFKDRFVDAFDDGFKAAVDAAKYLESGQRVECLLRAVGAGRYHIEQRKKTCPESIVNRILRRIGAETAKLTRAEFFEFSSRLKEWEKTDGGESDISRLPGKAYGEDSYPGLQARKTGYQSPRQVNQSSTSNSNQNINHMLRSQKISYSQDLGKVITLAGIRTSLKDDEVMEIVKDLLREVSAKPMGVTLEIAKSANFKRVCKIRSIPIGMYETIYEKLVFAKSDATWMNCHK